MRPAISQPSPTDTAAATARAVKATPVSPWSSCETTWSCTVRMNASTVCWPPDGEGMRAARKPDGRPRCAATRLRNSPGLWTSTWCTRT